jgi:excisionase family DNA binding protein
MSNAKIMPDHLARGAVAYIRQSSPHQVLNNVESKRRQYQLVERGHALGWNDVQVIDDDLGRSADGVKRPGFEKLLARICEGSVGIVLSLEASRLARTGREWHTLLEFCGVVNCLLADETQIYDPRQPDDRLVLGMKGTLSEMELTTLRQRAGEARQQKARRGELLGRVAIGYVRTDDNRLEKDPNRRVQDAIGLVFSKFAEFQTARQVLIWMKQERILLPVVSYRSGKRSIEWIAPRYRTIHHVLMNPIYSGAYVYGRRHSVVTIESGHKRITQHMLRDWSEWEVLIKEHHEGYITWEDFERHQRLMADNTNRKSNLGRGSIRKGGALLAGLCRCGRCGRRLHVLYNNRGLNQRYVCQNRSEAQSDRLCLSFGGLRVDRAVAQEILDRLQPLGIEAAIAAMNEHGKEHAEKTRQLENALEQARFETARAHRQYDEVDPSNRLVAAELERRWNEKLDNQREIQEQLAQHDREPAAALRPEDRDRLLALAQDIPSVWNSAGVTAETRKKITRLLIEEIVVDVVDDKVKLIIHWQGGDHTCLSVKKNKHGQNRWTTDADVVELVKLLARHMPDKLIAAVLNRSGKSTGHGNSWIHSRVSSLRHVHGIAPYREGERAERGEVTLEEAATALSLSRSTVLRMLREGALPGQQLCKGALWIIRLQDLERQDVRDDAERRRSRRPSSRDPHQRTFDL